MSIIIVIVANIILAIAYKGSKNMRNYVLVAGITCFMHEIFHLIPALFFFKNAKLYWEQGTWEKEIPNALAYVSYSKNDKSVGEFNITLCFPILWECSFFIFGISQFNTNPIFAVYVIVLQAYHIYLMINEISINYKFSHDVSG